MVPLFKILKDPLVHFLMLGLCLFAVYDLAGLNKAKDDDIKTIVVNRANLVTFIQYRAKRFEPKVAEARLNALSDEKLKRLIDDYVREEALYRESKVLGLGNNDYVIKRRMIQKVNFITQGVAVAAHRVGEKDLRTYYERNKERFREASTVTFTHVYFGAKRRSLQEAKVLAQAKLGELNSSKAPFSDAPKHGERFPYGVNYVERTQEYVASHMSGPMAKAIFELAPDGNAWRGPYVSSYGAHLVMLVKKKEARYLGFMQVRTQIADELGREHRKTLSEKAVAAIIDTYKVEIDLKKYQDRAIAALKQQE